MKATLKFSSNSELLIINVFRHLQFDLKHQIPPQNDVNYSIMSKVVEILEDNIKMRLLVNITKKEKERWICLI